MSNQRTTPSFTGRTPASLNSRRAAQGASKKSDTHCELVLRRTLWAAGLRYRISVPGLAGHPDVVFPRQKVVVFCDGDFWHGRDLDSRLARLARGHNAPYWVEKIRTNVARDHAITERLSNEGWRVVRLWETDILQDVSAAVAVVAAALRNSGSERGHLKPDKQDKATETVLAQAKTLGDLVVEEAEAAPPPSPERPFRIVPLGEVSPFKNAVPVLELAAAAGRFSGEQEVGGLEDAAAHPERFEWAELPDHYRPGPGMFVARAAGESMNRIIPNGTWNLFRLNPHGTRDGKIVLVQHRQIQDTDLGGHFTLKRYRSEKELLPDGTWRHTRIVLRPESDQEGYEPIEIRGEDAEDLQLIAEWLGEVGG